MRFFMGTNFVLNESLLRRTLKLGGLSSEKVAIEEGLCLLVKMKGRGMFVAFAGRSCLMLFLIKKE